MFLKIFKHFLGGGYVACINKLGIAKIAEIKTICHGDAKQNVLTEKKSSYGHVYKINHKFLLLF